MAKPGEDLFVGTYNQVRNGNIKSGLNATHTPHHAVQDAVSQTTHGKGATINLSKDLHSKTSTFGKPVKSVSEAMSKNANNTNELRVRLSYDVKDLRKILGEAGYNQQNINTQLQELIRQNIKNGGFNK